MTSSGWSARRGSATAGEGGGQHKGAKLLHETFSLYHRFCAGSVLGNDCFLVGRRNAKKVPPFTRLYDIIKTDEPRTLDFSGVRGFLVTNMFIVQCSVTYNVHSLEPYRISSTAAFSSSKVL